MAIAGRRVSTILASATGEVEVPVIKQPSSKLFIQCSASSSVKWVLSDSLIDSNSELRGIAPMARILRANKIY